MGSRPYREEEPGGEGGRLVGGWEWAGQSLLIDQTTTGLIFLVGFIFKGSFMSMA